MSKYSYWISAYKNGNYCLILLKLIFFLIFSCYEKRLHSPFLPLRRQNKEVWVSGLNQHTANVTNRKVPKVRNRLKRVQKPSLLGLCRASGDSQRNPSASAHWLVSSVGSEHDATNVGVGSSSLSRVTTLEVWQSSCLGKRHKCRAGVCDFVGSSPTSRTQLALWYNGSTTGFGPVSEGSIPSGATS